MSDAPQKQPTDLKRAFSEDGARKTHIGGQALIEGVMMRGRLNWAVGVREPDGNLYTEEHELASGKEKNKWMTWPVVRGCVAFVESLVLGFKALEIAGMHAFDEEDEAAAPAAPQAPRDEAAAPAAPQAPRDEAAAPAAPHASLEPTCEAPASTSHTTPSGSQDGSSAGQLNAAEVGATDAAASDAASEPEDAPSSPSEAPSSRNEVRSVASSGESDASQAPREEPEKEPFFGEKEMIISMVLGLVLGIVLFVVAPAWLTNLIVGEYDQHVIGWNLTDGVLRVAVFIFYIWLIGRMKDIKRMFAYHGAEHKTIHCYEHGLPLTPENARQFPRLHVRCGTAFLIMVMIIAILIYTILPVKALIAAWGVPDGAVKLILVIVIRIIFLPVIAGLSYEITVKWAGSHPDSLLVKIILWPGMQMQYLTTHEPDDSMLECAIAAMELVLAREEAARLDAEKAHQCEETGTPADSGEADHSHCETCNI